MTPNTIAGRRVGPRLAVLCLPVAAALVWPSASIAAGNSTVRASLGGDGSVTTVKQYAADGTSSSFDGKLPITLGISRTVNGASSTYNYTVQNTFTKLQSVDYTDTAGKKHTTTVQTQLPLVAELGVRLPASYKNVTAGNGAVVTINPDGTSFVDWQMVLFSPIGSPTQTLSLSATGSGVPVAELDATTVEPTTTAAGTQLNQAATAGFQQDDFWSSYVGGGNGGLAQLAAGTAQMVTGLQQLYAGANKLHTGLAAGADGANKLDVGTKAARDGAVKLSAGLGLIHGGQGSLTDGLGQISGGLAAMADSKAGLPAAASGLASVVGGLQALIAAVGPTGDPVHPGLLDGIALVQAGLGQLQTGIQQSSGCAADLLSKLVSGVTAGTSDPCFTGGVWPSVPALDLTSNPVAASVLSSLVAQLQTVATGTDTQLAPAFAGLQAGLAQLSAGLSHSPAGGTDPGGVKQVLQALAAGAQALQSGVTAAATGATQLATGAEQALSGSQQLTSGSGTAYTGSKALADGLKKLSSGQHQVATGLPAAVTGSGQIAGGAKQLLDGTVKVHAGIGAVQSGATGPLATQLSKASQNAHQQIAVLGASTSLLSQAPGGAGTSYVLTQDTSHLKLAADTSAAKSDDHTGRNVGIGLGGAALLVASILGGFALGRRGRGVA